jgi:hypothetical protein
MKINDLVNGSREQIYYSEKRNKYIYPHMYLLYHGKSGLNRTTGHSRNTVIMDKIGNNSFDLFHLH